jgi:hypothetical protein
VDLLKLGWYAAAVVVRIWALEQSEKWDALVASCKGRGSVGGAFRYYGSTRCNLCILGDSLWRDWQDMRSLRAAAKEAQKPIKPCGCEED